MSLTQEEPRTTTAQSSHTGTGGQTDGNPEYYRGTSGQLFYFHSGQGRLIPVATAQMSGSVSRNNGTVGGAATSGGDVHNAEPGVTIRQPGASIEVDQPWRSSVSLEHYGAAIKPIDLGMTIVGLCMCLLALFFLAQSRAYQKWFHNTTEPDCPDATSAVFLGFGAAIAILGGWLWWDGRLLHGAQLAEGFEVWIAASLAQGHNIAMGFFLAAFLPASLAAYNFMVALSFARSGSAKGNPDKPSLIGLISAGVGNLLTAIANIVIIYEFFK